MTLQKWIKGSTFTNIQTLNVLLLDEHVEENNANCYVSLDTELIKGIQRAFPNVQKLGLAVNVSDTTGLSCVFYLRRWSNWKFCKLIFMEIERITVQIYSTQQFWVCR